jgi:hypothetical protein
MNVTTLAQRINKAAAAHRIGFLQELRGSLRGKRSRAHKIFSKSTIHDTARDQYAYHDGGRTELQFNVGLVVNGKSRLWRYGVAFEFKADQTLPDPNVLRPWVRRFNIWVESNSDELSNFRIWDWEKAKMSQDRPPREITEATLEDLIGKGKFFFLGAMVPEAKLNLDRILRDFDRLYLLYEYCLKGVVAGPKKTRSASQREVSSARHTTASHTAAEIEVDLRHNHLQDLLVKKLKAEFPHSAVHPEWPVAEDCRVDVSVDTVDGLIFCEIKIASHVRAALRHAIGQLLEYAHWPDALRANKWWVVSEDVPSAKDVSYIQDLRNRYGLPIFYRSIDADTGVLGPET